MATLMLKSERIDINKNDKPSVSVDEIFVACKLNANSDEKEYALTDLYILMSGKYKKIKTYEDFLYGTRGNSAEGIFAGEGEIKEQLIGKKSVVASVSGPYYKAFEKPENQSSTEMMHKDDVIPYGLTRTAKLKEALGNNAKTDTFMLVRLDKNSDWDYFKRSEIFYYEENGTKKYLYNSTDKSFNYREILNKQLYVEVPNGSIKISAISTEKQYEFDSFESFQTLDLTAKVQNNHILVEKPTKEQLDMANDSNNNSFVLIDGKCYAVSQQELDKYYTELTPVKLEVPKQNSDKTESKNYYASKSYYADDNGNHIFVNIKGNNRQEAVELSSICDEKGELIPKDKIANYVGKSVFVKVDNKLMETEPLTYQQAMMTFAKRYTYERPVSIDQDKVSTNSYRQTKNGEYVKELDLKPKTYKFTTRQNQKADAYLVRIKDGDSYKEQIYLGSRDEIVHKLGIKDDQIFGLVYSDYASCEVIQTTSKRDNKDKLENCQVLKEFNAEKNKYASTDRENVNKDEISNSAMEAYKNGEYFINGICGNEKFTELTDNRSLYSDTHYMEDYAASSGAYLGLNERTITFEGKDGNYKRQSDKKDYSFSLGCAKGYAVLGKLTLGYAKFLFCGAGILAAVASPFLVAVPAAMLILGVPLVPLYCAVQKLRSNLKRFGDKIKTNREQWKKRFNKNLDKVAENALGTDKVKGVPLAMALRNIESMRSDVLAMSAGTVTDVPKIVDGKIEVNSNNINFVSRFKAEYKEKIVDLEETKSLIKKLENKLKRLHKDYFDDPTDKTKDSKKYKEWKEKSEQLAELQKRKNEQIAEIEGSLQEFKDRANEFDKDQNLDQNLQKVDRLKAYLITKQYGKEVNELLPENEKLEVFQVEQEKVLDELEFNAESNIYIYKGQKYNVDGERIGKETRKGKGSDDLVKIVIEKINNNTEKVKHVRVDENGKLTATIVETEVQVEKEVDKETNVHEEEVVHEQPKPTKNKANKTQINSESLLEQQLEDPNSATYLEILRLLTNKKGKLKMEEKDAKLAINDFIHKVLEAHNSEQTAKSVFAKDSVEEYILKQGTKFVSNLAQHSI